jgi:hypothetical protein
MSEDRPSRAPIDAWQAGQFRLTLFATPEATPLHPEGWWEAVTGETPERIETRPKVGQHLEDGFFLEGQLTLSVAANRIDWVVEPVIDLDKKLEDMPAIGPFVPVRDAFMERILTWIPVAPSCFRLAFGGRLLLPLSSREEGYHLLAAYLPFAPDPAHSSDLRYEINRHRPSRVQPGLILNRLQAWSVPRFQTAMSPAGPRFAVTKVIGPERFAISLEPDVNTDADFVEALPRERTADLVKELVDLAGELASEGDCP